MFTYLLLNLLVISLPLAFSFEKRVRFVCQWKYLFPAMLMVAIVFIIGDETFTRLKIWGFNEAYLTKVSIGHLPIEEIMFFFCIPYACIFIYECLRFAFNGQTQNDTWAHVGQTIGRMIGIVTLAVGLAFPDKTYSFVTFILLGSWLIIQTFIFRPRFLGLFFLMFLISIIPFLIVNGLLTNGLTFIDKGPVVWYNPAEILTLRIMGIPIEDLFYGLLLLLANITIYEYLKKNINIILTCACLSTGIILPSHAAIDDSARITAAWERAEDFRKHHDYARSRRILNDILIEFPSYAPALVSLAYMAFGDGQFATSAKYSLRAIRVENKDAASLDLKTRVAAHSIYAAAKGMLAHFGGPISKSANYFAVKKHIAIARSLDANSAIVRFAQANLALLIPPILGRDMDKAETLLHETIRLDPTFSDPYARLAQIYEYKGNEAQAQAYLQKALTLDAKNELAIDVKEHTCQFVCLQKEK